jgi:hypothetical protein
MKQIEAGNEVPQIDTPNESNEDIPKDEAPKNGTEQPSTDAKKEKEPKHKYGEYSHVRLTETEYKRLCNHYGEIAVKKGIDNVDKYCQMNGKTYKDYNLVLRGWGIKSPKLVKESFTALPIDDEDSPSEEWTQLFEG